MNPRRGRAILGRMVQDRGRREKDDHSVNDPSQGVYRFGEFELDPSAHTLRRGDERVHLQPKAFETLLAGGGSLPGRVRERTG